MFLHIAFIIWELFLIYVVSDPAEFAVHKTQLIVFLILSIVGHMISLVTSKD